jgi:hypothetical protein
MRSAVVGSPKEKELARPETRKVRLALVASATLITAILVSAAVVFVSISSSTTTETFTLSATSTETTTSVSTETTTLTTTSTSYSTSYQLLPAACESAGSAYFPQSGGAGTLVVGASSPAIVCLQLYDFNLTSPIVLNTASLLLIAAGGKTPSGGNFTITTTPDELTMGGPSDLDEGTIVAYSIAANPGASGSFPLLVNGLNVSGPGLNGTISDNDGNGPGQCPIGVVIAGTGTPNYAAGGYECSYVGGGPITPFSIPGFNFSALQSNQLYFKMVDAFNSTQ